MHGLPGTAGFSNGTQCVPLPLSDHGHSVIGCRSSSSSGGDLFRISLFFYGPHSMNTPCYTVAMDLGVCQLRNFSISFLSSLLGAESSHVKLENSSSGASVVAIDNKIEQAMDLVKSHLMYAVREEVEVLKEQIKELIERNSQLEQENSLLKTLASPEQMAQFQAQVQTGSPPAPGAAAGPQTASAPAQPASHNSGPSA